MLPEDSPDYELIPKPRVRSFPARKKKISLFNAVCVQCCERFRAQENSRKRKVLLKLMTIIMCIYSVQLYLPLWRAEVCAGEQVCVDLL